MRILFIHGGGDEAYAFDRDLVSSLSDALENSVPIDYPRVEGLEHIDWNTVRAQLTPLLRNATAATIVIGHSIGGSAILKALTERDSTDIKHAILLAPPYKAADSHWESDEFTFPNDFAAHLPRDLHLAIYHCEDDTVIPVEDAIEYRRKLPNANVSLLKAGGHQFAGSLDSIANEIRRITTLRGASSRVLRRS